jgi:4-hydroxy-3-methylbut-2-enyl diphosphate reductase
MKVLLAEKLGICPGVKNAISMAEKVLKSRIQNPESRIEVYSLGPIIHNKDVVEKLAKAGLRTVDNVEDILPSCLLSKTEKGASTVLIRSHGAAPAQIAALKKMGVNIVDATCVLVKKVQKIAKELQRDGYKVVVVGDENHPEVQAVVGCARDVVVVADESDLHKLPKNSKLGILCQTTQSPEYFSRMLGAIAQYGTAPILELSALACLKGQYPKIGAVYINTLCKEAIKRQESAVQLCKQVDIMFVLGGLESANTRRLAELCKKYNSQTFHLQNWIEFDKSILFGKNIAGVTAGASTPEWIITEFVENLEAFGPVPLETGGVDANGG